MLEVFANQWAVLCQMESEVFASKTSFMARSFSSFLSVFPYFPVANIRDS